MRSGAKALLNRKAPQSPYRKFEFGRAGRTCMNNQTALVEEDAFMEAYRRKLIIGSSICTIGFIFLYLYNQCIKKEYRIYIVRNKRVIQEL
jgi:hypothetical protein